MSDPQYATPPEVTTLAELVSQPGAELPRADLRPAPAEPPQVSVVLRETLARLGSRPMVPRQPDPPCEPEADRWARAAAERGCPQHRKTLDAARGPRETEALRVVLKALTWSKARSLPHRRQPFIVVLFGEPGVGKSVALSYAVTHFPGSARFTTAQAVASIPDSDWSEFVEARAQLARVPLLAIDEAGMESAARAGSRVALLLHQRYDLGLFTFVATNLEVDDFVARYFAFPAKEGGTEKIISRLRDEQGSAGLDPFWALAPGDLRRLGVEGLPLVNT